MRPPARQTGPARRGGDEGTLTLFAAVTALALLAVLAFTADAARLLDAASQARSLAGEAARAGTGQVDRAAAWAGTGPLVLSPADAEAAARAYLSAAGHTGTVTAGPRAVTVTVTVAEPAFPGLPLGHLSATMTATAVLTQGP